jgi:hypothetical protein
MVVFGGKEEDHFFFGLGHGAGCHTKSHKTAQDARREIFFVSPSIFCVTFGVKRENSPRVSLLSFPGIPKKIVKKILP